MFSKKSKFEINGSFLMIPVQYIVDGIYHIFHMGFHHEYHLPVHITSYSCLRPSGHLSLFVILT